MDSEEYNVKMSMINQRMEQISQLTANMAFANTANPSNQEFVALLKNQDDLIKAADRLIYAMQNQEDL